MKVGIMYILYSYYVFLQILNNSRDFPYLLEKFNFLINTKYTRN